MLIIFLVIAQSISKHIKDYYVAVRGIPEVNILTDGLFIPNSIIYPEGTVTVEQGGEDIRGEGNLGWRYAKDVIADPIQNYLNTTYVNGQPLKDRINYIVLCKGIPLKVRSFPFEWMTSNRRQVSVSALLCLINQPDPNKNFLQLYSTSMTSQLNPYFGADINNTMNYRFKSNHFVNGGGWYTQYLVSRLDGQFYSDVFGLIDRSADPDYSGEKTCIIDDDSDPNYHHFDVVHQKLDALSFSLNPEVFVISQDWITEDPNNVIGYVSHGVHAGMPWYYILSILQFNYANGANFLSWESFNCWSFGVEESGHGHLSHFIYKGGSGGSGTVYEPYTTGVTQEYNTSPAYAMGYSIVDAHFQGIFLNAWQNCVVGDPLTTIAWGKQTLTENKTLSGTNLVTGEVTIPTGKTMTIQNNSTIKFRHLGFITGSGVLNIGSNVTINTNSWSRSVLLCNSANNPRLVWAAHPSFSTSFYKVYRAVSNTPVSDPSTLTYEWRYTSPDASTFSFTDNEIMIGSGQYFYYYVTANLVRTPKPTLESDRSNYTSIRGGMYKKGNTEEESLTKNFSFSLDQNYPNPFNPVTSIKYQLQKNGTVTLKIFDILGNEVKTLVSGFKEKGEYTVQFDASLLPSGMYVYQLRADEYTSTKKMLLLK